ncbi:MAG: hypothetical protein Q27BPR15_16330 [Rhodobacter sp. CACIA14H1]|nr:MAG: hypothetical protein Q27BPR15_16330 [Rhodobacter sp. CACIA14H1]
MGRALRGDHAQFRRPCRPCLLRLPQEVAVDHETRDVQGHETADHRSGRGAVLPSGQDRRTPAGFPRAARHLSRRRRPATAAQAGPRPCPRRPAALKAPKLTLPPEAATLLREQYAKAQSILEFGSGGSTLVAAEREGTVTFSVESDADWADRMRHWFDAHPPKGQVHLHHADIGPTREWGYPQDDAHWRQFTDYPLSVWRRGDFRHPDVVLIDGRFRIGCFVGTLLNITRPTRILFDDYVDRPRYHVVEQLCRPVSFAGRMAVFDARPTALHPSDFGQVDQADAGRGLTDAGAGGAGQSPDPLRTVPGSAANGPPPSTTRRVN